LAVPHDRLHRAIVFTLPPGRSSEIRKEDTMKRFIMLIGAMLLAALPSSAAANPPDIQMPTVSVVVVDTTTCPFPIEESVEAHLVIATFYDHEGNAIRMIRKVSAKITILNAATGVTASAMQTNLYDTELATGDRVQAGLRFHVHVPGVGVILLDAGRVILSGGVVVFEAGQHQLGDGDTDEFCAYLATPQS
jgi:hypothetical protein